MTGDYVRVRIYLGESDRWHHRPLLAALVERLRKEGFAGATAFRGVAGFGAHSVLHTTQILRLSADLPELLEIIETRARLPQLSALLAEMAPEALVTVEPVALLQRGAGGALGGGAPGAPEPD